jgi:uncharacterized protein YjbI with pentapeptide repeats
MRIGNLVQLHTPLKPRFEWIVAWVNRDNIKVGVRFIVDFQNVDFQNVNFQNADFQKVHFQIAHFKIVHFKMSTW